MEYAHHIAPEAAVHGEAWHYFRDLVMPTARTRTAWLMFLAGWKAKAVQADKLRNRR